GFLPDRERLRQRAFPRGVGGVLPRGRVSDELPQASHCHVAPPSSNATARPRKPSVYLPFRVFSESLPGGPVESRGGEDVRRARHAGLGAGPGGGGGGRGRGRPDG